MSEATLSPNHFNLVRGICAILALGLITFGANTANAQATAIPVGNFSFETEGTAYSDIWYDLPDIGSWDKGSVNSLQIMDLTAEGSHFPAYNAGPEGVNILNLPTSVPLTTDLGTAISRGQVVTIDFHLGDKVRTSNRFAYWVAKKTHRAEPAN